MVRSRGPGTAAASRMHEFTALPSSSTVQTPHSASRQFSFVPVSRGRGAARRSSVRAARRQLVALAVDREVERRRVMRAFPLGCAPAQQRRARARTSVADQERAVARRGADVVDRRRLSAAAARPASREDARRDARPCQARSASGTRTVRGRDGAERDPRLETALAAGVQRQTGRHADHGDLHGPPPAGLEERGRARAGELRKRTARQDLAGPARRRPRSDQETRRAAASARRRAAQRDGRIERQQHRHEVGGRRGVDDVAAHRGDVADLVPAHDLGALDERRAERRGSPTPLELSMGDERAELIVPFDLDGVEPGTRRKPTT